MKKILSIVVVVLLLAGTAGAAQYIVSDVTYPILVNGQPMAFADVPPVNINGRTLLPLRAVAEAVGVPVEWDEANRRVLITQPVSAPETPDIEKLKDSCVMLQVRYIDKQGTQASGVLIDYDEILTCYHAVDEGANTFWATYDDGQKRTLTLTDTAPEIDAAILKPDYVEVKPVKIGDSDEVDVGDTVYVVSSPNGEKNVVTEATVLNLDVDVFDIRSIEITPVTHEGSSGGAVFNADGELIGIIQAGSEWASAVVPINDIRQALAA